MKYRYESFGGIIAGDDPPFLAFVDREYMRELGLAGSDLWQGQEEIGLLTAPTEVHFAITNRCSLGCPHCYMNSGPWTEAELTTAQVKSALDILASIGVFHVAFGGGESLEREDLFEIAEYSRSIGLVPNLTISGVGLTPQLGHQMRIFGQVNVSLDGIGQTSSVFRGKDLFAIADQALDILVCSGVSTGINCVLGRRNFHGLAELFEYAQNKQLNEIEFLRFKPTGRGGPLYQAEKTTYQQNTSLVPLLAELAQQTGITAKIDCSFIPMLCYHNPPLDFLYKMATFGCEAGNVLLGIHSNGAVCGCSFLPSNGLSVFDLNDHSLRSETFHSFTHWTDNPPEPCRSCPYCDVCKGGCRAVAGYVTGGLLNPDPDCPRVVDYEKAHDSHLV
jgi:radical SAM protein with 4Fe4S-binding SPASM domain